TVREVEFAAVANFVPHRHLSILRDITDRKQVTIALQASEAKYRRIVETALEGIWQVDAAGKTVFVNEKVAAMLGYASDEMLGKTLFNFMDQDSCNLAEQLWQNRQQGVKERHDFKFRHRSGRDVWAIVSAAPIFDQDQQMVGALGMIIDITERKQIETKLAQSEQWLAAFNQQAPAVIYTLVQDAKGQVWFEYLSSSEPVTGWTAEQMLQDGSLILVSMPPDNRAGYEAAVARSAERLEPFSHEWRNFTPTGELKWLQGRSQPERRANGDLAWYWVVLDITDRKQLEEERNQVEADLRQRETFFSSIYEGVKEAIFVIEVDQDPTTATCEFRYLSFNPSAEIMGRRSSQFVRGKIPEEAFGPVIGKAMRQNYQRCVTAGTSITYEEKAEFEDGIVWALTTLSPLCNPEGAVYRIVGIATDITEQKHLELSLRQSEAQLNNILNSVLAAITNFRVFADGHWEYEYCSPGCVTLFGYGIEELKADPNLWLSRVVPQDREQIVLPLLEKFLAGETAVVEYQFHHKDGSLRWISNSFTSQQVEDGWLVTAIGHDITERKQAEQKVLEQAMLLDITSDAIFVQDLEQRILYWNRGAEQLYGWLAEEALHQNADLLLQADLSATQAMMQALLSQSEWQAKTTRVTKTGKIVTVEGRWTVIRDQTGQPTSVLVVHTDITEKKQLETQFYRAQRLESLGTLASGVAHDLNNVLTPLRTITHLVRLQLADSTQQLQELLQLLDLSAERAADMVRQITTFSSGSDDQPLPIRLPGLLQEIVQILKQTFPKSIQIHLVLPEQPLALVAAGPTQIHQVLMNLCVNARDAMPAGGILTLSAQSCDIDIPTAKAHWNVKAGDYIVITVSDTGTGIPEDIQHRIFDPFFTTKPASQGTGLGLSTSLGIIRNYGGFLDVESEVGRGTNAKIYLPVTSAEGLAKLESLAPHPRGNGELVLIVDDEPALQQSNQALLESYGYRVLMASDGQEAIDLYQQHSGQIKLVVMDIMMPTLGGLSAIHQLKQINPALKIIAVSGLLSRKADALAAGGNCFLQKPYTAESLIARVQELLNQLNHGKSQRKQVRGRVG
ncbi:MAG: PAS domain S-box protein, partial [Elainella sp.]